MKFARVTLSDRASAGVYEDKSGPAIEGFFAEHLAEQPEWTRVVMPDEQTELSDLLIRLVEEDHALVVTTGGTGPAWRDVTPEATRAVLERELPGFGEIMRMASYEKVRTAILSRATAGTRGTSLVVNLPGNPKAIGECLPLLLPALVEALDHLRGVRLTMVESRKMGFGSP